MPGGICSWLVGGYGKDAFDAVAQKQLIQTIQATVRSEIKSVGDTSQRVALEAGHRAAEEVLSKHEQQQSAHAAESSALMTARIEAALRDVLADAAAKPRSPTAPPAPAKFERRRRGE